MNESNPSDTGEIQDISPKQTTSSDSNEVDSEAGVAHVRLEMQAYSGTIPYLPPKILSEYNEIVPGSAKRIFDEVKIQAEHRRSLEKARFEAENRQANIGLYFGFAVAVVALVGSLIVIDRGHDSAGTILATTSLVSLVGTFVYGTNVRHQAVGLQQMPSSPSSAKSRTAERER